MLTNPDQTPFQLASRIFNERDWRGDCYEVAGRLATESDGFFTLVHGEALGTGGGALGLRFGHAWTEFEAMGIEFVLDLTFGESPLPKQFYYMKGNISKTVRYTKAEAAKKILKTRHWGPWSRKLKNSVHNGDK